MGALPSGMDTCLPQGADWEHQRTGLVHRLYQRDSARGWGDEGCLRVDDGTTDKEDTDRASEVWIRRGNAGGGEGY